LAWQDEMTPTLRVMLGDVDETSPTYSDDRLEQLLALAAKQVSSEARFDQAFVGNVENALITPDPTAAATKDDNFVNLVTIKACCIMDLADARVAANRALLVKDGNSAVDLSKVSAEKRALLSKGWCAVYADAKFEYQNARTSGVAGALIIGPFRLYAQGPWGGYGPSFGGPSRNTYAI
jgi:hypothetical protein